MHDFSHKSLLSIRIFASLYLQCNTVVCFAFTVALMYVVKWNDRIMTHNVNVSHMYQIFIDLTTHPSIHLSNYI